MVKPEEDAWGKPGKYVATELQHDATITPWPAKDNSYDLIIALQVWEHLDDKEKEVLGEVMRNSKMAILSLPYKWDCPEYHMIDEEIIEEWSLHQKPEKIIYIPRTGDRLPKGPRIIFFWKYE